MEAAFVLPLFAILLLALAALTKKAWQKEGQDDDDDNFTGGAYIGAAV